MVQAPGSWRGSDVKWSFGGTFKDGVFFESTCYYVQTHVRLTASIFMGTKCRYVYLFFIECRINSTLTAQGAAEGVKKKHPSQVRITYMFGAASVPVGLHSQAPERI